MAQAIINKRNTITAAGGIELDAYNNIRRWLITLDSFPNTNGGLLDSMLIGDLSLFREPDLFAELTDKQIRGYIKEFNEASTNFGTRIDLKNWYFCYPMFTLGAVTGSLGFPWNQMP